MFQRSGATGRKVKFHVIEIQYPTITLRRTIYSNLTNEFQFVPVRTPLIGVPQLITVS